MNRQQETRNEQRAEEAGRALEFFNQLIGDDGDWQDVVVDLFADLFHYASREGMDLDELLERGRAHYIAESEDGDDIEQAAVERETRDLCEVCGQPLDADSKKYNGNAHDWNCKAAEVEGA